MRTGTLVTLCGAAMLAFVSASQAAPLAMSGASSAAIEHATADEGITQVRYHHHWRHYGWNRGHHYGWRHRHRPVYGYAPYRHHHRHGVRVIVR